MVVRDKNSPPTLSEVAAAAGVGRATAARTLGGYGSVSERSRQRVVDAANRLGYRANTVALSLRTGRTQSIGVVVAEIGNAFFAGVVGGIVEASNAAGFEPILMGTQERLEREVSALKVLSDKMVDGIILASCARDASEAAHIREVADRGIPIVLVDRIVPGFEADAVVIDNRRAAFDATTQLLTAGHRRIGFVFGPEADRPARDVDELRARMTRSLWSDGERLSGYFDAITAAGLPVDARLISHGPTHEQGAAQAVSAMLLSSDPPTAIVGSEASAILGSIIATHDLDLSYPRDLSLIGFDDSTWASVMQPPLTMIEQPMEELGIRSFAMLQERIDLGTSPARVTELTGRQIDRGSVAGPPTPPSSSTS